MLLDDYVVYKELNKIKKKIGSGKLDDPKILIDADDKLQNFKNVMILMTCVIKDDGKFYPQIILEEALLKKNGIQ